MSDGNKQRPVIDLDELERQLRAAAGARESAQPAAPSSDDPLAELARIVGQDDPYKSYWPPASPPEKQPQRHARNDFDTMVAEQQRDDRYAPAHPEQAFSHAPEHQQAYAGEPAQDDWAMRPALSDDRRAPGQRADVYADDEAEPLYEPQGQLPPHERVFEEEAKPARRKGWLAAGAFMSVAVVGVAGAMVWRSPSAMKVASGTPPLIKADMSPAKVAPENPGGMEVPNQDRQIYAKGAQDDVKGVKLVGGEEQPIDVSQATRKDIPAAVPAVSTSTSPSAAPVTASTASIASVPGLGEARRVKTVSVRPDGTIIDHPGAPEPVTAPARVASLAPTNVEIPAAPAPAAGVSASSATPAAPSPAPRPKAVTTTATTAVSPIRPMAMPAPTPAATPAPADVASTPKPAPAKPTQVASVNTADDASGPGGFAVQLAAPGSEQEARDTSSRLEKRFANELGGLKPAIRKADVNGKTIYRIRVGGLSREDATALCTKLQGSGGACFVAKN